MGFWSRVSLILSAINFDDEVVKEVGGECFARANRERKSLRGERESLPKEVNLACGIDEDS